MIEIEISHETIEAPTDPMVGMARAWWGTGLFCDLTDGCTFFHETEVADLCVGAVTESAFTLARVWSNSASAAGRDPCQPPLSIGFGCVQGPTAPIVANRGRSFDVALIGVADTAALAFDVTVTSGDLGASLDQHTLHAGDTVHLHLDVPVDYSAPWPLAVTVQCSIGGTPVGSWPVEITLR
jgi:hypothetical protein